MPPLQAGSTERMPHRFLHLFPLQVTVFLLRSLHFGDLCYPTLDVVKTGFYFFEKLIYRDKFSVEIQFLLR